MRKLGLLLLLVAVMFAYSNEAAAAGLQKGASEIAAFGSLSRMTTKMDDYKDTTNTNIGILGYNYFLTDQVSAGANLLLMGTKSKDNEGSTSSVVATGIDLNAKYHFTSKGQTVVPYLGLQGGWMGISMKSDGDSLSGRAPSYGGMGGVKFFITENIAFNTELNYRRYNIKFSGEESKAKINNLSLLLGFSVYFGK
jgi:outer membrane protein W